MQWYAVSTQYHIWHCPCGAYCVPNTCSRRLDMYASVFVFLLGCVRGPVCECLSHKPKHRANISHIMRTNLIENSWPNTHTHTTQRRTFRKNRYILAFKHDKNINNNNSANGMVVIIGSAAYVICYFIFMEQVSLQRTLVDGFDI